MRFLLPLLLCVTLVGCGQPEEALIDTPNMSQDAYNDASHDRVLILYGSKNIHKWVKIKDPRMGMAGRLAKVAITIENKTQSRIPIEYQITWLDLDGFPLPVSTAPWVRFSLPENAEKHIMDVAKMPNAYSAQILVRGARDIKIKTFDPEAKDNNSGK